MKKISWLMFLVLFSLMGSYLTAQSWTKLNPTGSAPTTRLHHTAVYDVANNRMMIFGGYNDGTDLNDIWVLSNANGLGGTPVWEQLSPTGGPLTARSYHTAVYDSANNRMVIFGGFNGSSQNDVWVLSAANGLGGSPTWTKLTTSGSTPMERYNSTAIYDAVNNRMTIFGGKNGGTEMNDVWVLSNANGLGETPFWTQITTTGTTPLTRNDHIAVYDTSNNRMTIFGGENIGGNLNDVWVLNNANGLGETASWTNLTITGSSPTTRAGSRGIYDSTNNGMIIFGGYNDLSLLNDVWVLSNANGLGGTSSWSQITTIGSIPNTRTGHSAVYDPTNNRMTIFGGRNNGTYFNDIWLLSLGSPEIPVTGDIVYTYDNTYRLVTCAFTNGISIIYNYDSSGNRLGKSVDSKLRMSLGQYNPGPATIPENTVERCLLQVHLQASNDEYIQLTTVRVTAYGTGNDASDILNIKMYQDVDGNGQYSGGDVQLGNTTTFNSDNGSATFSGFSLNLSPGTGTDLIFVANIDGTGNPGKSYGVKLTKNTDIGSIGINSGQSIYPLGAPIIGQPSPVVPVELSEFEIAWR